jgi:PDZ domain-containing protein
LSWYWSMEMKRLPAFSFKLQVPLGIVTAQLGLSWLVVLPAGVWAIQALYIPILGGPLTGVDRWIVTLMIGVMVTASLAGHTAAHALAARWASTDLPRGVPVFLFGETAQVWPAAQSAWGEALGVVAGPLFNIALGGLAYLVWNAQWNSDLSLSMLCVCIFNGWLALVNLIPAYPFDGGRLLRLSVSRLWDAPAKAPRVARYCGYAGVGLLIGWAFVLLAQRFRFSSATFAATLLFAALMGLGLAVPSADPITSPALAGRSRWRRFGRAMLAWMIVFGQLDVAFSLALTNQGLEAPGVAIPVEPMVAVPTQYRHTHSGVFFLTSVISQAPITAGEWLAGKLDPTIRLIPPESIVPNSATPQEVAQQGFQMLDQSELTAIVVGVRLAGYTVGVSDVGVEVVSLQPDSLAQGVLQPGDVIVSVEGSMTSTPDELVSQLQELGSRPTVKLAIKRNEQVIDVVVPLLAPTAAGGSPKLGIAIEPAGFQAHLPFPVNITPQKIVGGPSAGLMFALTVCSVLSPNDLTGGQKVAGTGTISLDGTIGPIGGVEQKVAAAEAAGASYFLSPVENYADAGAAARHLQVIQVATIQQAVTFLHSIGPIPAANSCQG